MKWSSNLRPDGRPTGVICTLLSLGLCVIGLAYSQSRSLADVPPLYFTNSSISGSAVSLAWDPSPDTNVVGYLLCWGTASGQCTNQLDAKDVTSATLGGFTNLMYYFDVVAYNSIGLQADPSNEVQYSPTNVHTLLGPTVGIQPTQTGTNCTGISLSCQGTAGATYAVLARQDFIKWDALWTTNCAADAAVVFSAVDVTNYIRRFYRVLRTN